MRFSKRKANEGLNQFLITQHDEKNQSAFNFGTCLPFL
jgi:hypothetical protein